MKSHKKYKIILYNNGKRVRVIHSYNTYINALTFYNKTLKENIVYFPKQYLWTGEKTGYELVLTAPSVNIGMESYVNEQGDRIKITTSGDFVIKKITKYAVEDVFTEKFTGVEHTFKTLVKILMRNSHKTYAIFVLNNKVLFENFNEDDDIMLFIFKNKTIALSLVEKLKEYNNTNKFYNYLYFTEPSLDSVKRIYSMLNKNYGIQHTYMYKVTTR